MAKSRRKRFGLLGSLLGLNKPAPKQNQLHSMFASLGGYSPVYSSYDGGIYEIGLCRACINRIATSCGKASPELTNKDYKSKIYNYLVKKKPNPYMTASQFYKRLATIYFAENNAFIIPIEDEYGMIKGLWPAVPSQCQLKEINDVVYIYFNFIYGETKLIEYSKVGHLRQMQYKNDYFGDVNDAFDTTAKLMLAQEEGAINAIKSSSIVRFLAKISTPIDDDEDYKEQQNMILRNNLNKNETGVFLIDNRFDEVKPIESKPLLVDAKQKQAIENSVYSYFGISEAILQNKYKPDEWNAFYESIIEPFFIEVGEVLSGMLYSVNQVMNGSEIILTSDRLQYDSTQTKLNVATQMFDRGMIDTNGALNIMNKAPLPDDEGKKRFIRGEYIQVTKSNQGGISYNGETEPQQNSNALNSVSDESGDGKQTD